jgi:hypothetical protein
MDHFRSMIVARLPVAVATFTARKMAPHLSQRVCWRRSGTKEISRTQPKVAGAFNEIRPRRTSMCDLRDQSRTSAKGLDILRYYWDDQHAAKVAEGGSGRRLGIGGTSRKRKVLSLEEEIEKLKKANQNRQRMIRLGFTNWMPRNRLCALT